MPDSDRELRIFVVETDDAAAPYAAGIIEALRQKRRVRGGGREWSVTYTDVDPAEPLRLCREDLSEIGPRWGNVLDFAPMAVDRL